MNSKIGPLLVALIVLVTINIAVTSYVALRPAPVASPVGPIIDDPIVSDGRVAPLAKHMITLFNAKDVAGLYGLMDDFAKAQISQEQLSAQIDKLHSVLGTVGTYAYDRAELAGTDAGRTFYNISYKVSLSGGSFAHGTLKLTVLRRGDELRLVGFFLNGSDTAANR